MIQNTKKIQPGWEIPIVVRDAFRDFCVKKGAIVQEDCAGALFLWQQMPAQIREWAKLEAKGLPAVDKPFWIGLGRVIDASIPSLREIPELPRAKKSG